MAIQYIGDDGPDGSVVFQSGQKGAFFGRTTVTVRQAVVTTVDSTTITTVKTAAITTVDTTWATTAITAETTMRAIVTSHAKAINRLSAEMRLKGLGVNRVIADSRSSSKAVNQLISKTRALGLFASS